MQVLVHIAGPNGVLRRYPVAIQLAREHKGAADNVISGDFMERSGVYWVRRVFRGARSVFWRVLA